MLLTLTDIRSPHLKLQLQAEADPPAAACPCPPCPHLKLQLLVEADPPAAACPCPPPLHTCSCSVLRLTWQPSRARWTLCARWRYERT